MGCGGCCDRVARAASTWSAGEGCRMEGCGGASAATCCSSSGCCGFTSSGSTAGACASLRCGGCCDAGCGAASAWSTGEGCVAVGCGCAAAPVVCCSSSCCGWGTLRWTTASSPLLAIVSTKPSSSPLDEKSLIGSAVSSFTSAILRARFACCQRDGNEGRHQAAAMVMQSSPGFAVEGMRMAATAVLRARQAKFDERWKSMKIKVSVLAARR